ncbi:peptidoglycan-binding protein [Crystallibacter degradans]|uniref:peptidoglycan-binding protein n=1 Tax=Crystallibacter degradans TaxID=2726743 RepID=UPI0014760426|nr:peptidoglycan-binding protein [Arthrobacter sp. SF27]NMR28824.1 N-acetylmuramoyl-L-alanine amidase [Arthrobacter sp. SF27]
MDNDAADQSLRRSDTSRRVVALRERLLRAGISMAYLAPDQVNDPSVFDDHVDAAVRTFQQNRGLMVDGVAGPETLRALGEAQYNLGDRPMLWQHGIDHTRGDDVSELQRQLSYLGFYYGHIDGEFGERTHLAVRELQQNLGLEPTGVADAPLIAAMARVNRSISPSQAFSLRDYERLNQASAALKGRVVCLTAGSGTSFQSPVADKASGRPLTEKLVASDVMRRVESILSGLGAAVSVVEVDPENATGNRVQLIRQSSPSLSISINCDWLDQPMANGVSAFFWGKPETGEIRSPIGHRAAELILKEVLARTTATDLGIHGRSWDILRLTSIPSIQLDIGYLSNPDEAGRLADPVFRQVLADAVVIAIQRLYLLEEDDEPTGTLALDDVLRFNPGL